LRLTGRLQGDGHGVQSVACFGPYRLYPDQLVRVADLPGRHRLRSSTSYRLHVVPAHRLVSAGRRMFPVVNAAIPCSLAGGLPSSVSGTILLAGACRPLAYTEHVSETLYHLTSITVCLSTTEDIPIS